MKMQGSAACASNHPRRGNCVKAVRQS